MMTIHLKPTISFSDLGYFIISLGSKGSVDIGQNFAGIIETKEGKQGDIRLMKPGLKHPKHILKVYICHTRFIRKMFLLFR